MTSLGASGAGLDDESLLAALTLAPGVYSRNRMFDLYERNGRAKALRASAYRLRGIASTWLERPDATLTLAPHERGFELVLDVPSMAYRRTLYVSAFERGLLALLLEKAAAREAEATRRAHPLVSLDEKSRVEVALARLTAA